jgi:hypothetical protein
MTDTSDAGTEREGYSVAVTESAFDRMKSDPRIRITDHTGMGPMSEFDIFVSFGVVEDDRL